MKFPGLNFGPNRGVKIWCLSQVRSSGYCMDQTLKPVRTVRLILDSWLTFWVIKSSVVFLSYMFSVFEIQKQFADL